MFSRKLKTVALIMESFRKTITDLEDIIEVNVTINDGLHIERAVIAAKIEDVDLEIHQARGVHDRMSDLVFGPNPQEVVTS